MKHPVKIEWIKEARRTGPPPTEFDFKATIWLEDSLWSCRLSNRVKEGLVEYGEIDFLMKEAEKLYLTKCQKIPLRFTEGQKVIAHITSRVGM
jgi:hypothetical protein